MDAKISLFVVCVKAILYLLLCNLHGCTFKCVRRCDTSYRNVLNRGWLSSKSESKERNIIFGRTTDLNCWIISSFKPENRSERKLKTMLMVPLSDVRINFLVHSGCNSGLLNAVFKCSFKLGLMNFQVCGSSEYKEDWISF